MAVSGVDPPTLPSMASGRVMDPLDTLLMDISEMSLICDAGTLSFSEPLRAIPSSSEQQSEWLGVCQLTCQVLDFIEWRARAATATPPSSFFSIPLRVLPPQTDTTTPPLPSHHQLPGLMGPVGDPGSCRLAPTVNSHYSRPSTPPSTPLASHQRNPRSPRPFLDYLQTKPSL